MRIVHSSDSSSGVPSPVIRDAIEAVSEARLRGWVKWVAVPRNFYAEPESNRETARWLRDQLREWGYEVIKQGPLGNIIALPKRRRSELILVGAHYDSVPETPGADDNASAVAAMLCCAEIVAKSMRGAPVCFVAFNCEENGLEGSIDFVGNYLNEAKLVISQAHILEMVGFANAAPGSQKVPTGLPIRIPDTGDFLGLLANRDSARHLNFTLAQARTYLPDFKVIGLEAASGVEKLLPVLARSDHAPFWHRRIPALMWTDTSEFRNHNYHRVTDTPETLDYRFLRRVAQLLIATVAEQAR